MDTPPAGLAGGEVLHGPVHCQGSLLVMCHASAAMTLDVYADLFESDLDAVADRLDSLHRQVSER